MVDHIFDVFEYILVKVTWSISSISYSNYNDAAEAAYRNDMSD